MYNISAVLHDKKVYIMAGCTPDDATHYHVYCYDLDTDEWELLPPHKYIQGVLIIINGKLTILGGWDTHTNNSTNNVSTFLSNKWTNHFPNLLRARCKPGVVSHSEYAIVAGGGEGENGSDDIEVLDTSQPSQWIMTSFLLPEPMWDIFITINNNMILIVGYNSDNRYSTAYQLPVDEITSSHTLQASSGQPTKWMELPSAPHYDTVTIPNSHPPVIMGGRNLLPTSDVAMLDDSSNQWQRVASLSSPRSNAAVVPINSDTILLLGGISDGVDVAGAKAHSITTVEKGKATLTQRACTTPAIPTEDRECSIQ